MNRTTVFFLLAMLGIARCLPAQSWTTVDSAITGTVHDLAFAPNGTGYAVIATRTNGVIGAVVRRSRDAGETWSEVLSADIRFRHLDVQANGHVYLGGEIYRSNAWSWVVWKSADEGDSWSPLGDLFIGNPGEIKDLAVDPSGGIYLVGMTGQELVVPGRRTMGWKGVFDRSGTWTWKLLTCDTNEYQYSTVSLAVGAPSIVGGPARIYALGGIQCPILASDDRGMTWAGGDCPGPTISVWGRLVSAADGALVAGGYGIVRRGTPNPAAPDAMTWTYLWYSTSVAIYTAVAIDPTSGTIYAGGEGSSGTGWRVLASPPVGGPLQLVDSMSSGVVFALAVDPDGNVFAGGRHKPNPNDPGLSTAWIRKLASGRSRLHILHQGPLITLSYATNAAGFLLQSATTLSQGGDWTNSSLVPQVIDGRNVVTIEATGRASFFRLRAP